MLQGSKRITITTEAVNRYGFWVLTSGIELAQYEKNPLMLFMHAPVTRESLPIGQIVELKVETDGSITGLPLFDDEDPFAVQLYKKYEKGVIKMASAGLIPVEWSEELLYLKEGQRSATLIKSILDEVSLCDRGVNNEALKLCDHNGERIKLSVNGDNPTIPKINKRKSINMKMIELKNPTSLLTALNLAVDVADEGSILLAVNNLIQENVKLSASEKDLKAKLEAKAEELTNVQLAVTNEKIADLKAKFVSERKATADEAEALVKLAAGNYDALKALYDARPSVPTAQSQFSVEKTDRLSELVKLSYSELHKSGQLAELKDLDSEAFNKKVSEGRPA